MVFAFKTGRFVQSINKVGMIVSPRQGKSEKRREVLLAIFIYGPESLNLGPNSLSTVE
jgi:hypothetical protein